MSSPLHGAFVEDHGSSRTELEKKENKPHVCFSPHKINEMPLAAHLCLTCSVFWGCTRRSVICVRILGTTQTSPAAVNRPWNQFPHAA